MAKFDFENSRYAKLWSSVEGRQLISYILNDPNMIHNTPNFWSKNFEVDRRVTPTDADGKTAFTVKQRPLKKSSLMHTRAPLGDTVTRAEGEAAIYNGTIGDFIADGYVENAMERKYRKELATQAGVDTEIINMWVEDVQRMVDDGHATLDYLSAVALSTGKVRYTQGNSFAMSYYKAAIPASNFTTAGAKVWSDPNCKLLDQMRLKEKSFKEDIWGTDVPLKWQIPYNIFHNVFLKNQQVIDYVKDRIAIAYPGARIEDPTLVYNDIQRWLSNIEGVSPIEVVESKQYDGGQIVTGWKEGIAVLRPQGYAGVIKHASILDEEIFTEYGSSTVSRVFNWTRDRLMLLENSTHNNGELKEWQTRLMMSAVPVLDDFLYHVLLDTTTADN